MRYRVKYIPIKDGDELELGSTGSPTSARAYYATKPDHLIIGFKPGPGPRAVGWLVVLVNEEARPVSKRPRRVISRRATGELRAVG